MQTPNTVYRKTPWLGLVLLLALVIGFAITIGSRAVAAMATLFIVVVGLVPLLVEFRRMIVITPEELISRPRRGAPVRIPFSQVAEAKETIAVWSAGRYRKNVPAVKMVLRDGNSVVVPLDFKRHKEILSKIRESIQTKPA